MRPPALQLPVHLKGGVIVPMNVLGMVLRVAILWVRVVPGGAKSTGVPRQVVLVNECNQASNPNGTKSSALFLPLLAVLFTSTQVAEARSTRRVSALNKKRGNPIRLLTPIY